MPCFKVAIALFDTLYYVTTIVLIAANYWIYSLHVISTVSESFAKQLHFISRAAFLKAAMHAAFYVATNNLKVAYCSAWIAPRRSVYYYNWNHHTK